MRARIAVSSDTQRGTRREGAPHFARKQSNSGRPAQEGAIVSLLVAERDKKARMTEEVSMAVSVRMAVPAPAARARRKTELGLG